MDIEEYTRNDIKNKKTKESTIKKLTEIIEHYKSIEKSKAELLATTVYNEVESSETINDNKLKELLQYPQTNIHMGEFGVGSRGQGDFYVHSKIAEIINKTNTNALVNPTAQDDGGVVQINNENYITTAIDGIHSRLSEYPFIAGFHTARATLRDVCVMGAKPVALISDIHLADDGDIGKLLDYTAGICAVSELTDVPLVSGSTLRIGGDMVLGDRLVGAVGSVGVSKNTPTARSEAKENDIILMTEGSGGGTISTTAIYNNYEEVIEETLNVQFIEASKLILEYENQDNIHAMTDITNGGIRGDANEINKTTGLGIHLYYENIVKLINPKVKQMLEDLEIDPLGVSIDSLMIIVSKEKAPEIIQLLKNNNIKTDKIGVVTNSGKTCLEDKEGNIKTIKPEFREAAYTPIKKVIDSMKVENFEESKLILDKATVDAVNKKNKIVKKILNKQKQL